MARSLEDKHSGYYEAILQLRDVTPEIIQFAEAEIKRVKMRIAKKVKLKNGQDYFLTDNTLTRQLGRKLQEKFGGEFNISPKLFSKKDGKEIYRLTVLFRGILFKRGDKVEYGGEEYFVKSLSKDIFLKEIKTGKKVHLKYKDMRNIKRINQSSSLT